MLGASVGFAPQGAPIPGTPEPPEFAATSESSKYFNNGHARARAVGAREVHLTLDWELTTADAEDWVGGSQDMYVIQFLCTSP